MSASRPLRPQPDCLARAAGVIRAGGVVAYPTEACFGLGCDPRNPAAIRRILQMKRRPRAKGLILIADRIGRLLPYITLPAAGDSSDSCTGMPAYILDSWPGPHTWLLPVGARASGWLRGGHACVAVRVTAHRQAAQLCRLAGMPLVSTSANRAGRRMLRSGDAVRREFGGQVDFIVDGRIGNATAPSSIRHYATGEVLRG